MARAATANGRSNLTRSDWVALIGIFLATASGMFGWLNHKFERIEDHVDTVDRRVSRIEGALGVEVDP